jgi:hypothetical protein
MDRRGLRTALTFEVTKLVERKKGAHIILAEASFTLR